MTTTIPPIDHARVIVRKTETYAGHRVYTVDCTACGEISMCKSYQGAMVDAREHFPYEHNIDKPRNRITYVK